jgi:hypothetical protein
VLRSFLRALGARFATALLLAILALTPAAPSAAGRRAAPSAAGRPVASTYAVAAVRQKLTRDPRSSVAHDNEVMALASHSGRLFAATDQWEYSGPAAYGQVLVKNSSQSPWKVFERTQSTRVQVLDSFPIPSDQGLGAGHSLLITQAIVDGRSPIQWLLDGARSFTPSHSFALSGLGDDVRSFGAHESGGVWAVYAGVNPTGILRGAWSRTKRTLVFSHQPELTAAPPKSPGLKTRKVTAFADCGGALYVTINTRLYRRNDGPLRHGIARWVLVYQEPPVGSFNSGLRGLSCITHRGGQSLLVSIEGNGNVYRFDHLPRGQIDAAASAVPGHGVAGLVPVLEFSPIPALRRMLAAQGTAIPAKGRGSIDYVIAAYNNFETVKIDGIQRQLFGVEHAYLGECPAGRTCGPTAFGAATFDAAACFAIRTDRGTSITYALRCLSGPSFRSPGARSGQPVRGGQAFVSIRTIKPSPFAPGQLYYGGYDCNFSPADGTAWVGSSTTAALDLNGSPKGGGS